MGGYILDTSFDVRIIPLVNSLGFLHNKFSWILNSTTDTVQDETQQKTLMSVGTRKRQRQERRARKQQAQRNIAQVLVRVQLIAQIHGISKRYLHSFRASGLLFAALPLLPRTDVGDRLSFQLSLTSSVVGVDRLTSASGSIVKCKRRATVSGVN